mgnify:CR=1 FL=1
MKAIDNIYNNHGDYLYEDLNSTDIKKLSILEPKSKNLNKEIHKYMFKIQKKYANKINSSLNK